MSREFAIIDDNGIVHRQLDDTTFAVAWAMLTKSKKQCFDTYPKLKSQPQDYEDMFTKYHKETKGELRLIRMVDEELPVPFCTGCKKFGDEIEEYVVMVHDNDDEDADISTLTFDYIRKEEGTYNESNGHFLCTICYVEAGQPSTAPGKPGWVAP